MQPSLSACVASGWVFTADTALRLLLSAGLLLMLRWSAAQRAFPGQASCVGMQAGILAWLLISGLEQMSPAGECKFALALLSWPAMVAVAPLWLLFLRQYADSDYRPLRWRWRAAVLLPMLLLAVLAATNGQHHGLYGPGTALLEAGGARRVHYEYGPAFYVAAGYSYLCVLASLLVLGRWAQRAGGERRRHLLGFLGVAFLPCAANLLYLGAGWRINGADPSPFAFSVAALAFAWLVRRNRMFRLVPLARRLLIDELPDPVLILDVERRVMEANPAAHALAGTPPGWNGRLLDQWPVLGPALAAQLDAAATKPEGGDPALLRLPGGARIYDLQVRAIGTPPHPIGQLVQLHDITGHQQAQDRALQALAERSAQLAQASSLQHKLREQALRDPLTGLYNRRALIDVFADELLQQPAAGNGRRRPIALAMLDIDHFKTVNDRHGHAVGDEVLRGIASVFGGRLRTSDKLFRIGGEEFLLLMPGADASIARTRLAALRNHIAQHPLQTSAGALPITWSAGVAEWPTCGETLEAVLQAADEALYGAKAQGRDRILLAGVLEGMGASTVRAT